MHDAKDFTMRLFAITIVAASIASSAAADVCDVLTVETPENIPSPQVISNRINHINTNVS